VESPEGPASQYRWPSQPSTAHGSAACRRRSPATSTTCHVGWHHGPSGTRRPRPGVVEECPQLVSAVLEQLTTAGYTTSELDEITLLTSTQRADLFQIAGEQPGTRHLTMV